MKRSSRIEQKRILRLEEEARLRVIQEMENEMERQKKEQRKRKRMEKQRMKKAFEKEEQKRKKLKSKIKDETIADIDNGAKITISKCNGTGNGAGKSDKHEPIKKKKISHKLKFKPKIQREEIDISNTIIQVITATAAQIRKSREKKFNASTLSKTHQKQLIQIPSQKERSIIYEEAAKAIAVKESHALPPHGGRPWKCIVSISDDSGGYGAASSLEGDVVQKQHQYIDNAKKKDKKKKKQKSPLFRWFRGKLELACLPHLFEQIDVIDTNHGLLKSVKDEYDTAMLSIEGEKATDLTSRQISILSTVAWNDEDYSIPNIDRKWISPDHLIFKSRSKTIAHCSMLDERDKIIDKVLHGIGLRGATIRPAKPTRKQALEAGYYRFLRDGLWVVGQEEEWIKHRIEEWNAEIEKEEERVYLQNGNGIKINVNNDCAETNKASTVSSVDKGKGGVSKSNSSTTIPSVTKQDMDSLEANKEGEIAEKKLISRKRKTDENFVPSQHWRLTEHQNKLCIDAIMEFYEKVSYTIKARALHSELADGFDVFRQRGRGRYDMQLPVFDTEEFNFLTDLDKAAWMPVVKKILGDDATIVHKGAFLSMPGSSTQIYHQDGVHLTTKYQRPCHAINVFIPLVNLDMKNGPTEFCVGTHILGYEYYSREMIDTPLVPAGCPVIFDYRLGHRGLANSSSHPRPIVYLTYTSASKEFRDSVNFSQKRYHKLGELVEKPLSREERAMKRARDLN